MEKKILNLNSRESSNLGTGKNPVRIFIEEGAEKIFTGGVEPKTRIKAKTGDSVRSRDLSLIKRPKVRAYGSDYSEKWELFKQVGLPVVTTLRTVEGDENEVYVTDLTADGSEIYGKSVYLKQLEPDNLSVLDFEPGYDLRKLLIEIPTSEIKVEALKIADLATANKIYLPNDDPLELVVNPSGKWKLIILDLEKGIKIDSAPESEVKRFNYARVDNFIFMIEEIKNILIKKLSKYLKMQKNKFQIKYKNLNW